jgi:hypothetical protein
MQYQEAVAEARRLDQVIDEAEAAAEEAKWARADLAWTEIQAGVSRVQWAKDTGKADHTIGTWVRMAERWPASRGSRPSFIDAHNTIRGRDEQVEEYGSQRAAEAHTRIRNLPPEQKAAVVREALDDQDVAVRVLRDPHTRRNVTDAREQVANEIETAARDRTDADPQSRAIREASLTINIESNISKARFWLAEATRQIQDLDERDPAVMERLARDVDDVDLALGWLRTAIEGGRVSDEDLARLLEGGA